MKTKRTTKLLTFLAILSILIACIPFSAAADSLVQITLRIEGIDNNVFYDTFSLPYSESLTVQDLILHASASCDELTIKGAEGDTPYITDINGDVAGKFGGWDGWLFTVNGEEATAGIQDSVIKDGDNVILYYGDPYGIGMQYPTADTSDLKNGILRFYSIDTTFDADWNPVKTENPVSDMKVIWNTSEYITDENGEIKLNKSDLTLGTHSVSVEKKADNGAPLVLRLSPDFKIEVTEISDSPADDNLKDDPTENPNTADKAFYLLPITLFSIMVINITKRRFA